MLTNEQKLSLFKEPLESFETEKMRNYAEDMVVLIPDNVFYMPSSSSGKYHNATQCQIFGNTYHIIMLVSVLNYRLSLKANKERFPKEVQRDAMRVAGLLHDGVKYGWNNSPFTLFDHPLIAGEWIRNTKVEHDIKQPLKDCIAKMVEAHSGEWTTSNRNKNIILPEPANDMEFMIHECDILASRYNIDMGYSNELLDRILSIIIEWRETYKLTFGKHAGCTLIDIKEIDMNYFKWLKENYEKEPVRSILQMM